MTKPSFRHRVNYRIHLAPEADGRAPGGAVTVALCGHWDHKPPCRWPHYSTIHSEGGGVHRIVVEFDAPDDEVEEVRNRIQAGLRTGRLTGPDGILSVWRVED